MMNHRWITPFVAAATVLVASSLSPAALPVVSIVSVAQQTGNSKLVDIHYDLTDNGAGDPCSVWVLASNDGGTTWNVPVVTVTGDVGPSVSPGTGKHIVWDAAADIPGLQIANCKIRVMADDGNGMANMVWVPQDPAYTLPGYWIDKYEVTSQRYCEFLNASQSATNFDSRMEITKTDSIYAVEEGRENYPIRYVSYYDAEAFANWLSQREGRTYRLPTSDEWYKAAAWDPNTQQHYTYGFHSNTIDCASCNYNYCIGNPNAVGSYPGASHYGCYDMTGNVWEWTSELSGSRRVLRGGAYSNMASDCACTNRNDSVATDRINSIGFRLVLGLE